METSDITGIVEAVLASIGSSPSSDEVEAAAVRVIETSLETGIRDLGIHKVKYSVSVAGCTSRRSATQRARVYDRIRLTMDSLNLVLEETARELSVAVPPVEMVVRDSSSLFIGHPTAEILSIAEVMAQAAEDTGVFRLRGPFLDLAYSENAEHLTILPELLSLSAKLSPRLQLGTRENGSDPGIFEGIAYALGIHQAALHRTGTGSRQVTILVNGCDRRAFDERLHPDELVLYPVIGDIEALSGATTLADSLERLSTSRGTPLRTSAIEMSQTLVDGAFEASEPVLIKPDRKLYRTLDGLPVIGPFRNRISVPAGYSPADLSAFLMDRLVPSCHSGIQAGLHVDFPKA